MTLSIDALQYRQSYVTASEIAWVICNFHPNPPTIELPSYVQSKTKYQWYCEKTATKEQLERISNSTQTQYTKEGSDREKEAQKAIEAYFQVELAQEFVRREDLCIGATPDLFIRANDESRQVFSLQEVNEVMVGKGICEIKLTRPLRFSKKSLKDYHLWQVQHQLICCNLPWGVLAMFHKESCEVGAKIEYVDLEIEKHDKVKTKIITESVAVAMQWIQDVKSERVAPPFPDFKKKKDILFKVLTNNNI